MWRSLFLDDSELWFEFDLLFMWCQNMNYGELRKKKTEKIKNLCGRQNKIMDIRLCIWKLFIS